MHSRISKTNHVRNYNTRRSHDALRAALSGPTPKTMIDKFTILPISACVFSLIVYPLLLRIGPQSLQHATQVAEARPEPRFFWPAITAISVFLMAQNSSRLTLPPHLICLLAYLLFAGASVLWAFSPEHSSIRYIQQVMMVTAIVLPVMLATRTADMMRALFVCLAFALVLNLLFVFQGSMTIASYGSKGLMNIGYQGYFGQKNELGECAAMAYLLALHEVFQRGWRRRALGAIVAAIAIWLVFLSQSKTAFALASVCPLLAWLTLYMRKATRASPLIILLTIPLCFILLSGIWKSDLVERISYMLYHNSTLTGRTIIWDFAKSEIASRPLFGWGYQSFWLVPGSPSLEAPGFVKMMPNAHNGYYDTILEMGYAGLAFLLVFIGATLHAVGRVADRDPRRARLLLSLALFFILYNFFESLWMRGFLPLWVMFVIVVAEIGRYWRPFPLSGAARSSAIRRAGTPDPSPAARVLRPNIRLS